MIPNPGSSYTVVRGDTLWDIAGAAYGNPRKWKKIYNANKAKLRDPKIYPNTVVLIFPGEVLFIPVDGDAKKLESNVPVSTDEPAEKLRFVFDGNDLDVISGRVVLCINTIADAFSFSVDTASLPPITPFGLDRIDIYIDDNLLISGMIFKIDTSASKDGEVVEISGYSSTQRITNSVSDSPFVYRNKTLLQITKEIVTPFSTVVADTVGDDYRFKKAKIGYNEKIGSFLLKLSSQRRMLVRSNSDGEIEITRANTTGKPVVTVSDDTVLVEPIRVTYNAENRFSKYIARGKNPSKNIKGVYLDNEIKSYCATSKSADELTSDKIKEPAEWLFRQAFSNSVGMSFKIDGFYSEGVLIRENNIVAIEKKTLGIKTGRDFLIKSVEYVQTVDSKTTAVEFTIPEVYTDDDIVEDWGIINA